MSYTYDSRWFMGVPNEEVDALKAQLAGDKKTLDKLRKMLYNMSVKERDIRIEDYESPSWACKMAHINGKTEAFLSIMRLVTLSPEEPVE